MLTYFNIYPTRPVCAEIPGFTVCLRHAVSAPVSLTPGTVCSDWSASLVILMQPPAQTRNTADTDVFICLYRRKYFLYETLQALISVHYFSLNCDIKELCVCSELLYIGPLLIYSGSVSSTLNTKLFIHYNLSLKF